MESPSDLRSQWSLVQDPRTVGWFMVGEVWPLVNLMVLYVFGVKLVGPRMMKDRRPFDIRHIVLCYNFLMILACVFFLTELIRLAYVHNRYSPFLQEVDMTYRPATLRLVSLSWWYYLLRVFEFTEAVFFVLKKKFSQVSFCWKAFKAVPHCFVTVREDRTTNAGFNNFAGRIVSPTFRVSRTIRCFHGFDNVGLCGADLWSSRSRVLSTKAGCVQLYTLPSQEQ